MSEWITDRRPTEEDAGNTCVWVMRNGRAVLYPWDEVDVEPIEPWMPIAPPEPYVKPRRFYARWDDGRGWWMIERDGQWFEWLMRLDKQNDEYREAAERIAAIYEEVMP